MAHETLSLKYSLSLPPEVSLSPEELGTMGWKRAAEMAGSACGTVAAEGSLRESWLLLPGSRASGVG